MNQRIIYPTDDGGVAIIIPAAECGLTIEEIAAKDVPEGKPYQIVDVSDIPEDRTFRGAWEADFTNPDGVGIGADAWFAEQEAKKLEAENDNNQSE
jgi:hypothetical protein